MPKGNIPLLWILGNVVFRHLTVLVEWVIYKDRHRTEIQ